MADEDTFSCAPALFEEEQLSRILSCPFKKKLSSELETLNQTLVKGTPPTHYTLNDAAIIGGEILTLRDRHFMSHMKPYLCLLDEAPSFDEAYVPNSVPGLRYFGHWLRDDCSAYELAKSAPIISMQRPYWTDCLFYEKAFGQNWSDHPSFFAQRLNIINDVGFSQGKRNRLVTLRARLRKTISSRSRNELIYLKRGQSGRGRGFLNESEFIDAFVGAGGKVIEPEQDMKLFAQSCIDAQVIISVEGSQLAHATYLVHSKGAVLTLQPPDRFYNPHLEWCRLLGVSYGIVIGEPSKDGFEIRTHEVFGMIDRLMKKASTVTNH